MLMSLSLPHPSFHVLLLLLHSPLKLIGAGEKVRPPHSSSVVCPFCNCAKFSVEYHGPPSKEDRDRRMVRRDGGGRFCLFRFSRAP